MKKPLNILKEEDVKKISVESNMHFGIFKRRYRDELMGSKHTDDFIEYMLNNFTIEEVSTFKKIVNQMKLSIKEIDIAKMYEKVGFIKDGKITIPAIEEKLTKYKIKQSLTDEDNKLNINLDLFTKSEKAMIEYMNRQGEVSKEEIAKIIWGGLADEKYSEWAIEQRVSRLRKKLKQLGYKIDIETLYNKGYRIILN